MKTTAPAPARTAFDPGQVRRDFPVLRQRVYDKPLVYLDNAATSQKPQAVIDALVEFYSTYNANIHRGAYFMSQKASDAYEEVREKVKNFIHAAADREIVFTRGTTESVNLVASTFGEQRVGAGDEVVVTAMEHHSNIVPWQMLCDRKKAKLRVVPMDRNGELDLHAFEELLSDRVKMVAFVHTSNSLGTVNPAGEMVRMAHRHGIPVLIDGAQSAAHEKIDVQELDCDFFAFSGHKILGPTGTGVLYAREALLEKMPPYQGGGDMIASVKFEKTTYNDIPFRFEAGTQNIADVIGMGAALDYWASLDREAVRAHEDRLLEHATRRLGDLPGVRIIGHAKRKAGVVSFVAEGVNAYDMGMFLDTHGIAVRTGLHCTEPVMDFFGIAGTARASFLFYNTLEEIDKLAEAVRKGIALLGAS